MYPGEILKTVFDRFTSWQKIFYTSKARLLVSSNVYIDETITHTHHWHSIVFVLSFSFFFSFFLLICFAFIFQYIFRIREYHLPILCIFLQTGFSENMKQKKKFHGFPSFFYPLRFSIAFISKIGPDELYFNNVSHHCNNFSMCC